MKWKLRSKLGTIQEMGELDPTFQLLGNDDELDWSLEKPFATVNAADVPEFTALICHVLLSL